MKFWKHIGIAALSLVMTLGVGLFAVACGDGEGPEIPVEGSDEEHAIALSFENDKALGNVTINELETDSGRGKKIQRVYYKLTAPQDGYYILEAYHLDAEITKWDGTYYPTKTLEESRTCAFDLKKNDELQFVLSANANVSSASFPLTYSFEITLGEPPVLGSADNPEEITEQKTYTVSLKKGESYYYVIADKTKSFFIKFEESNDFAAYDYGASPENDDRRTDEYRFISGKELAADEWYNRYIAVFAEEDCNVSFNVTVF